MVLSSTAREPWGVPLIVRLMMLSAIQAVLDARTLSANGMGTWQQVKTCKVDYFLSLNSWNIVQHGVKQQQRSFRIRQKTESICQSEREDKRFHWKVSHIYLHLPEQVGQKKFESLKVCRRKFAQPFLNFGHLSLGARFILFWNHYHKLLHSWQVYFHIN